MSYLAAARRGSSASLSLSPESPEDDAPPPTRGKPNHAPPASHTRLGRPEVRLPCSQLLLGRTSPPWNARAWRLLDRATVVDDALRVFGACDFKAAPRCLPAVDVALRYRMRFVDLHPESTCPTDIHPVGYNADAHGGGSLPGLLVSGGGQGASWVKLVHRRRDAKTHSVCAKLGLPGGRTHVLDLDDLQLHGWNHIVLRLKLNKFVDGRPLADGTLTVCVNGKAATASRLMWRTAPAALVSSVLACVRGGGGVECAGFCVTT